MKKVLRRLGLGLLVLVGIIGLFVLALIYKPTLVLCWGPYDGQAIYQQRQHHKELRPLGEMYPVLHKGKTLGILQMTSSHNPLTFVPKVGPKAQGMPTLYVANDYGLTFVPKVGPKVRVWTRTRDYSSVQRITQDPKSGVIHVYVGVTLFVRQLILFEFDPSTKTVTRRKVSCQ